MYFISHLCNIICHVLLPASHSIVKFCILSVFPGKICILREKPFKCNIKFLNTWFLFLTFEGIKWTKKIPGLPVSLKMPLTNKTYLVVCSCCYFFPEFSKKSFSSIKVGKHHNALKANKRFIGSFIFLSADFHWLRVLRPGKKMFIAELLSKIW